MARLSNHGLIPEHKRLVDIVHAHNVPIIAQFALGEYQNKEIDELTDSDIDTIRERHTDLRITMKINRDRYLRQIIGYMWDGQVKVITDTAVITLCRESVFFMIGIVSADKLLGTLSFQFGEIYMAPHAGLCYLDNRNCDI